MRVSVKYFGHLRDIFGTEESYDLFTDSKPHLFSEILNELVNHKGEAFLKTVYKPNGSFNPHISVILNRRVILNDKIKVDKDCSISFIPFIGGGWKLFLIMPKRKEIYF